MYIAIDVCRYFLYIDHFYSEFGVTLPISEKIMFQISDNNELKILNYPSYRSDESILFLIKFSYNLIYDYGEDRLFVKRDNQNIYTMYYVIF